MTQIIDGKLLSQSIRQEISHKIADYKNQKKTITLVVIIIGEDPASHVYVNNKIKACKECGINSKLEKYNADISQDFLLQRITQLNNDNDVNGILIQLPLPRHINSHIILEAIHPLKDVDGFHMYNAGALMIGQPNFIPCTPYGCMKMLHSINYEIKGANAVVIGASNIVGKPMAMLLLQAGATVTICNSKTKDLILHTSKADIIVIAVGKAKLLKAEHIKTGAVIIDVGINRQDDGTLCGDADFNSIYGKASYITPVPGGVGPMTITMLMQNTLTAYCLQNQPPPQSC